MAKNRSVWGISSTGLLSTEFTNPEMPGLNVDVGECSCREEGIKRGKETKYFEQRSSEQ